MPRKAGRPLRGEMRVLGPYRDGKYFLVVVVDSDGTKDPRRFKEEKEAKEVALALKIEIERQKSITLEEALGKYEAYLRIRGCKPGTIDTALYRLRAFFPQKTLPLAALTPKLCESYYQALAERHSVDTHRNTLSVAKNFFGYLCKEKFLKENPAEEIEGVGKRNKGKEQLRFDEARRWAARALELAEEGREGAVAALMALLLALRASEIVNAQARDVDDGGRLFWVPDGKTINSRRRIEVPEILQPYLLRQARGKKGDELLFLKSGTRKHHRDFVRYWVQRICRDTRVPEITAHGMRGLHASLAQASGVSALAVAQTLGHGSPTVTQAHYSTREAQDQARTAHLLRVLEGGRR